MWGHLFLLLRDIAVNESDHERVSDSGAIRSGLVPQLRHSAIHKRSLTRRTLSVRCIPALAEALQPPVAGEAPSTGRKVRRMRRRARKISGSLALADAHRRMSRLGPHWSPTRYPLDLRNDWSSVTLHRLLCGFLLRLPPRGPPLSVHRRSIAWSFSRDAVQPDHAWSRPSGRQSPVATRTVASKWAFAGLGGSGYLRPARCTRGSRRCLNGWL